MADPTPSFDTSPRLQPTVADPTSSYAPIAWSAVFALLIGVIFALLLLIYGLTSIQKKEPLVAPLMFVLPVIGIAVAFVARRQIRASEGTRIGLQAAAAGWWLCVVFGLVYAAYLGALEYTIRADAVKQFRQWVDELAKVEPDAVDQQDLFVAFYRTLPPRARVSENPTLWDDSTDPDGKNRQAARELMRDRYGALLLKFRQHPIVQQISRYRDECKFTTEGLREWKYQGGTISCTLAATMHTPEGDFPLVMPLEAVVAKGIREWQIKVVDGNIAGSPLRTSFGFLMGGWVTYSGRMVTEEVLNNQKAGYFSQFPAFAGGFGGGAVALASGPASANTDFAKGTLVTLPGGGALPADKVQEFRAAWENEPYRFRTSDFLAESLAENANSPIIEQSEKRLVVKFPLQYQPRGAEGQGAGVRMKLVMECIDPQVLADLAAARTISATEPRVAEAPKDSAVMRRPLMNLKQWKLIRFESDLQILRPQTSQSPSAPGLPPGGPGG